MTISPSSAPALVSVLIRTRNRAALLQEAVQSVLLQDYPNIEIVIVNDGGDNFAGLCQAVVAGSTRSLVWLENAGRGRSAAANTALAAARGDYCLFLDDDDLLDANHLSRLVSALQASTQLVAYTGVRTATAEGTVDEHAFDVPFDAQRLYVENYIPIHAALFARELLTHGCSFDVSMDRFEDWDFWLQLLQHSSFVYVPGCSATYRIAADSGFGTKQEEDINQLRTAFYRKWSHRWDDTTLLALLDRSRTYPRLLVLERENTVLRKSDTEVRAVYEAALAASEAHMEEMRQHIARRNAEMYEQHLQFVELQGKHAILLQDHAREQQTTAALRHDLDIIYNSRSWKLTKPLRLVSKIRTVLQTEGIGGLIRRVHFKLFLRAPQLPAVANNEANLSPIRPLVFTPPEQPLISIVIPVYNKIEYTFHCLDAILRNSGEQCYEVIVVDDCSSDNTQEVLSKVQGIRVIRNEQNGGFIYSCNAGAAAARGEYLLLFNNDTEPQAGWLQALLQTFHDFPDAGMVGAKLLFGNGQLQEAGGIIWRDGSGWNYGRLDDPNKPEYSYSRRVDYCSGACLMLPLADYRKLGMFDSYYAPAYYEDTDLAFKVRESGKQVYYQPLARVVHFEGISNGTDTGAGIKAYQVANHAKFFARWQEVLQAHRPPGVLAYLEKERRVTKRALVVDARILMPDNDSGSLRMFNLLKILQKLDYKVTFIPDNLQYDERYTPKLQALGIECWHYPYLQSAAEHLQHHGSIYDVIILSRADIAEKSIDAAREFAPQALLLFDTVDLHFLRERRSAELSGSRTEAEAAEMRRLQELNIARKAHKTLIVSPAEIELFRKEAPDVDVALISNIHSVHGRARPWAEREDILFIGTFEHPPNIDAMNYFIDEVFPLLHQAKPDLKLYIVGPLAPKSLLSKASPHIIFTGFVEDIAPLFHGVRLSIAPLRYGAGVKGKINSSMSYGVPVVATTIAAEGMGLEDGVDVLIADDAADFAAAIVRAYDDEELWTRLSDGALANLQRYFSFEVATQQMRDILKAGPAR